MTDSGFVPAIGDDAIVLASTASAPTAAVSSLSDDVIDHGGMEYRFEPNADIAVFAPHDSPAKRLKACNGHEYQRPNRVVAISSDSAAANGQICDEASLATTKLIANTHRYGRGMAIGLSLLRAFRLYRASEMMHKANIDQGRYVAVNISSAITTKILVRDGCGRLR